MSNRQLLERLGEVENLILAARHGCEQRLQLDAWLRDSNTLAQLRERLENDCRDNRRWALDLMRNFSQGFGTYCHDLRALDDALNGLHESLTENWPAK